jgi:hypothetical protein
MELQPHEQRVILESEDLKGHMDKLEAFIVSAPFYELTTPEQFLLRQQFTYMAGYLSVLEQRIALFKQKAEAPAAEPGAQL